MYFQYEISNGISEQAIVKTLKKLKTAYRRVKDVELSFRVTGDPQTERRYDEPFTDRLNVLTDLLRQEIEYVKWLLDDDKPCKEGRALSEAHPTGNGALVSQVVQITKP